MISNEAYRGLRDIRASKAGLLVKQDLVKQITAARDQYELNPATEANRRKVQAYKVALAVLFTVPLEEL